MNRSREEVGSHEIIMQEAKGKDREQWTLWAFLTSWNVTTWSGFWSLICRVWNSWPRIWNSGKRNSSTVSERKGLLNMEVDGGIRLEMEASDGGSKEGEKGWNKVLSKLKKRGNVITAVDPPISGHQVHTAGLPSSMPTWAPGTGFSTGRLDLGGLSMVHITTFQQVWNSGSGQSGASFYNPVDIPEGYYSLGSYGNVNNLPPRGWVLAVKGSFDGPSPALAKPTDYTLVWTSADWAEAQQGMLAFFWAPVVPEGYKALGFVVTNYPDKPGKDDIVLVREDLTDSVVLDKLVWDTSDLDGVPSFSTWTTKPSFVGVDGVGIPVNTLYCNSALKPEGSLTIACLKNVNSSFDLMPSFEQLKQIMSNYGPTVFCHPEEAYLPTTPEWFFENGALLYTKSCADCGPVRVANDGSNLPKGGSDDGEFWLDLPNDDTRESVKGGNLSVAKVSVHVKPMFGGIFTDVSCWIYHCFNGSVVAKLAFLKTLSLGKIGEHVGDWEHFVIRVDNFTGEMRRLFTGQHAAGTWFRPDELEFVSGNRAVVYSAKNSHALYAHEGNNLQGDQSIGIGIRNDTARSNLIIDTTFQYQFIDINYLFGKGETEFPRSPPWVDYMRLWGPNVTYDSKTELDKIVKMLPKLLRKSVTDLVKKLPVELGGETGPTGPKEKASWNGDEKVF